MSSLPSPETITLGLGLIALGLAWTLANLGYFDLLQALRLLWPALLIVWGVLELRVTLLARRGARP